MVGPFIGIRESSSLVLRTHKLIITAYQLAWRIARAQAFSDSRRRGNFTARLPLMMAAMASNDTFEHQLKVILAHFACPLLALEQLLIHGWPEHEATALVAARAWDRASGFYEIPNE